MIVLQERRVLAANRALCVLPSIQRDSLQPRARITVTSMPNMASDTDMAAEKVAKSAFMDGHEFIRNIRPYTDLRRMSRSSRLIHVTQANLPVQ